MKYKIIAISIAIIAISYSCSTSVEEKPAVEKVEEGVLTLNGDEKWQVNEETHKGMTQIKVILENMDSLTLEDYQLMGQKCDEQTSFIISNCSMTGEPHNQLHYVLHPVLNDIEALMNAETINAAESAFKSLRENISNYFNYFA